MKFKIYLLLLLALISGKIFSTETPITALRHMFDGPKDNLMSLKTRLDQTAEQIKATREEFNKFADNSKRDIDGLSRRVEILESNSNDFLIISAGIFGVAVIGLFVTSYYILKDLFQNQKSKEDPVKNLARLKSGSRSNRNRCNKNQASSVPDAIINKLLSITFSNFKDQ